MKESKDFYNSYVARFGFFLHHNFGIHLLLVLFFNFISAIVAVGLLELFKSPALSFDIIGFVLFIIIVTLIEVIIKIFVLRHFIDLIFKTKGIITFVLQNIIFYVATLFVNNVEFNKVIVLNILVFSLIFFIIRFFLINIYQKNIMIKYRKKI